MINIQIILILKWWFYMMYTSVTYKWLLQINDYLTLFTDNTGLHFTYPQSDTLIYMYENYSKFSATLAVNLLWNKIWKSYLKN